MRRSATRHSSLTEKAALLCKALRQAGFHPHPGPINARGRGGGDCRVKINSEPGRIRLRVTGHGVQEVFLYGPVAMDRVVATIKEIQGVRIESIADARLVNKKVLASSKER
ncbi:MAG: hypothetical protein HQL76_03230 [Magnetococcales bacterium]|nr:hypothetical protein [Magnetococcales bacterium]